MDPVVCRRDIDAVLGRGSWEITERENRSVDGESHKFGDPIRYRQWTIGHTGADGRDYQFHLTNSLHRTGKAKYRIWNSGYVGRREDLTPHRQRLITQRAQCDVVAKIFDPAAVLSVFPSLNGRGVCMDIEVGHSFDFPAGARPARHSFLHDNRGCRLSETAVEDLLATGGNYIQVTVRTQGATEQTVQDINRKAGQLSNALIERYGECATFAIRILHFDADERFFGDYARNRQFHFACGGGALSAEETGESSPDPAVPRMEYTVKSQSRHPIA